MPKQLSSEKRVRPAGRRTRRARWRFFRRRLTVLVVVGLVAWLAVEAANHVLGPGTRSPRRDAGPAITAGGAGSARPRPGRTHHVRPKGRRPPPSARPSKTAAPASPKAIDPSMFSPGSCEEFQPTAGNRHRVVFLDAGHGGIDPGAVGTTTSGQTVYEADETLPVELDTMALLRAQGFTVVVSRTTNTTVLRLSPDDVAHGDLTLLGALNEVAARDVCANKAHADVLVGIYFDAGASASNAGCVSAYDTARPFAADSERLANLVQTDVLGSLNAQGWQIPNEGAIPDSALGSIPPSDSLTGLEALAANYDHLLLLGPAETGYFSTPSQMPGTVVEPLYITDPFEANIAVSSAGQHIIAGAIAKAVEQYFG